MLEDSPRMLQNEMEKSLGATLVAAVECFSFLDILRRLTSGGWNSQNDSGSGNLKANVSSLSYPVASEGPPPKLCAKSGQLRTGITGSPGLYNS